MLRLELSKSFERLLFEVFVERALFLVPLPLLVPLTEFSVSSLSQTSVSSSVTSGYVVGGSVAGGSVGREGGGIVGVAGLAL